MSDGEAVCAEVGAGVEAGAVRCEIRICGFGEGLLEHSSDGVVDAKGGLVGPGEEVEKDGVVGEEGEECLELGAQVEGSVRAG